MDGGGAEGEARPDVIFGHLNAVEEGQLGNDACDEVRAVDEGFGVRKLDVCRRGGAGGGGGNELRVCLDGRGRCLRRVCCCDGGGCVG